MSDKISAVIVAHNEEDKIQDCLESLGFVDEIVVVLDKCSDKTKEIVSKHGAKIVEGSWNIEGERRNIAINNASHEWILEIDADERICEELVQEILEIKNQKPCAYKVPIANYIGDKYVKNGWLRTLGVVERQTIHYKGSKIYHEDKEIHPTCDLNVEIKSLKNPIIHLVDDNIADLLNRFNRYTTWRANDLIARNKVKKINLFKMIASIKLRFLKAYIIKKGFLEGYLGILISLLGAIYPMVSYLKAKEKNSGEK